MRRHARWLLAAGTLLLLTTVLYAQQTGIPSRLLVKTDANNYLLTSSVAYTGPDSARQNFQNIVDLFRGIQCVQTESQTSVRFIGRFANGGQDM